MYQSSYKSMNQLINTYRNARLCVYVFVYSFMLLWKRVIVEKCYDGIMLR